MQTTKRKHSFYGDQMTATLTPTAPITPNAPINHMGADGWVDLNSITPPEANRRSTALALVPPNNTSTNALVQTFKAVAQKKGPAAAIESLMSSKAAGPLQALIKTPPGRMVLSAVVVGGTIGWTAGSNAQKVQAVAAALQAVSKQNLSPSQTAQQVVKVLKAALTSGSTAIPSKPDRTANDRQVQALGTSLKNARADLKETAQLLKQRPGDRDLQVIIKGQAGRVQDLERKFNATGQSQAKPTIDSPTKHSMPNPVVDPVRKPAETVRRLPNKVEELSPWLQEQVRRHGMPFDKAVTITKNEWIRRNNMPEETPDAFEALKTCEATVETINEYTVSKGRIATESMTIVEISGSPGTISTKFRGKVINPETNKTLANLKAGGPGQHSGTQEVTTMNQRYDYGDPKPSPTVTVSEASCKFSDGMVMPAQVETLLTKEDW
jgi:hypothetical protein